MMRSLRQTMLNLLSAGLFHLVEQQLAAFGRDGGFIATAPSDTKMSELVKWYQVHIHVDLRSLPSWALVDELRLW